MSLIPERATYAITNKSFEAHEYFYGSLLDINNLKGKTVLDLGSGKSSFAKELKNKGINAFSLDMFDGESPNKNLHVRGFADALPFKNNVFDFIYSSWSVFSHLCESKEIQEKSLREVYRTLKPGGKIIIDPVFYNRIKELLKEVNIPIKITKKNKNKSWQNLYTVQIEKIK